MCARALPELTEDISIEIISGSLVPHAVEPMAKTL
ncbi:MAG: hypothetical protein ACI9UT_001273 [Flavobacteriales bacterium]